MSNMIAMSTKGMAKLSTLQDVAKLAGVSTATVSRVLNDSLHVNDSTRKKVLDAIHKLNYAPNALARGTVTQKSGLLGMLIPDIRNTFFAEVYLGASAYASQKGYTLWLMDSGEDPAQEEQMLGLLHRYRVSGALVIPVNATSNEHRFLTFPSPLCFIDRELRTGIWDFVGVDHFYAGLLLTNQLLVAGHERIGIIAGPQQSSSGQQRLAGYKAALQGARIKPKSSWIEIGDFHEQSGYDLGQRLLTVTPSLTAIISGNRLMSLGLLQALRDTPGVHYAESVTMVGFGDFPLAGMTKPGITVITQPAVKLGSQAAQLLIERIETPSLDPRRIIVGADLMVRGSEQLPSLIRPR